nr:shikimate dehydrogenase [Solirubrobacterales bacterium]
GLLEALAEDPAGRRTLVLGAGGSARAAVHALVDARAEVEIWNRTPERARRLAAELGGTAVERLTSADLLVNCTAVGLDDSAQTFKDLPFGADDMSQFATVVDLVYSGAGETQLISAARDHGSRVVDGLEILVCQGALSFTNWTGCAAPIAVMREAARGSHVGPPHP